MRKTIFVSAILIFSLVVILQSTNAQKRGHGLSVSMSGKTISDCSDIRIRFGDAEVARSEQQQNIPRTDSLLEVRPPKNGGIHIEGSGGNEFSIKACLAARGDSEQEAREILNQLKLSVQGGRVTVLGPEGEEWVGYLLIHAPNGASLDLTATNGPIALNGISGNIQARATNGPISFNEVTGQIRADVQNGPIDVTGSGGDFRINAKNGPLTVELMGSHWSGELEGHTQNGPLTLRVPEGYGSAVRVDASKHSPVECLAPQCREAVRTWDRPSVIQFGGAEPVVRLSTVNGPVTITSPGHKR
jgi:hypothetical protein